MDTSALRKKKQLIHHLCADTWCCLEDLLRAIADRDELQESVKWESTCLDDDNDDVLKFLFFEHIK